LHSLLEDTYVPTLFLNRISKPKQFLFSALAICIVAGVCFAFSGLIGYRVVAFVLLVTVSLIAMFFDILPVMLSALLSALIWDFFFIPPRFTFYVGSTENTFMLATYFVIASVNAVLTYKIRQVEKLARQREERANAVKLYNVLFNSLSHELKTPIATIMGTTDSLLSESKKLTDENKDKLLSEISIATIRLNEQVENLLNMSRLESGYIKPKFDWCDVNELIHSSVNRIEDKFKNHHLKIEISEKLPLFKLDFGLVEQALHNLLVNAILYTPDGSTITVTADTLKEVKGRFNETDFTTHRDKVKTHLVLEVLDNGSGFPQEEMENVFNKFYRLKNAATGGTGLGLSIAKGFVEAHHGVIELANRKEGGAKFTIRIPAETSDLKQTDK
jgi:two-component system sensor histidine kinase KdpD